MGLFGPSSLEERIMQIIEKQERVLQKWPCMLEKMIIIFCGICIWAALRTTRIPNSCI